MFSFRILCFGQLKEAVFGGAWEQPSEEQSNQRIAEVRSETRYDHSTLVATQSVTSLITGNTLVK